MEVQEKINQIGNIIHAALNGEVIEDCIVLESNDRLFIDIDEESYTVILDEDLHYIILEKSQEKGEYIGTYTINSESYYIFKLC